MSILLFALDSRPRPKQSYKTVVVRNATRATKQQIFFKKKEVTFLWVIVERLFLCRGVRVNYCYVMLLLRMLRSCPCLEPGFITAADQDTNPAAQKHVHWVMSQTSSFTELLKTKEELAYLGSLSWMKV